MIPDKVTAKRRGRVKVSCMRDLAGYAKNMSDKTVVAVVEAHDEHTVESVLNASGDGIIIPLLIGNADKIKELLLIHGADPGDFEIVAAGEAGESLRRAIDFIHSGRAAALMKGNLQTPGFMRAVLDKANGLLTGERLSAAGLFEAPHYHKIFAVSDMVVNTEPNLGTKRAIIENAVGMLGALGIINPKVAVLAASEKRDPKMPETIDADELKTMNIRGEIKNCVVEGPISFDLATNFEAAEIKGYVSPVAGDADLLIVPNVSAGNILVKCLTGLAGAATAGTVLGAKVPIILTSRSADASDKYNSIALAACVARLGVSEDG